MMFDNMKTTSSVSVLSKSCNRNKNDNQNRNCGGMSDCEPPLICCSPSSNNCSTVRKSNSLNYHNHNYNKGHGHSSSNSTASHFLPLQMKHLSTAILILLCLVFTPGLADSETISLGKMSSILANSTGHHHHSRPNPSNHNHHNGSSSSGGGGHHGGGGGHGHGAGHGNGHGHHRCYVCLPPDRNEAEGILAIFPEEIRPQIPDCSSFGGYQSVRQYAFRCPQNYAGCQLRIHGENVTRSCAKFGLNDCKTANKVELCYCTGNLCNYKKPEKVEEETQSHQPMNEEKETDSEEKAKVRLYEEQEEAEARKFEEGDTDDEDLLQPHNEQPWEGSGRGGCDESLGVLCAETTTPKPTLVPNLRPTPSTPPPQTAGAPSLLLCSCWPILSILFTCAYQLVAHSFSLGTRPQSLLNKDQ